MDLLTFLWAMGIVVTGLALEAYGVITGKGTITESVRKAVKEYPPTAALIALVIGSLFAHFFWQ